MSDNINPAPETQVKYAIRQLKLARAALVTVGSYVTDAILATAAPYDLSAAQQAIEALEADIARLEASIARS